MTVVVRRVRSAEELVATFDAIGRQFDPPMRAPDRRLDEPLGRFPDDRPLQLLVLHAGRLAGGVIAFRRPDGQAVVRAIGIDAELRGHGVGRRLLELVEIEAMSLGCREIGLGAAVDARGFYEAMGYRGKRSMRSKALPPPGRLTELRITRLRAALGDPDLEAGAVYEPMGHGEDDGRPPELARTHRGGDGAGS